MQQCEQVAQFMNGFLQGAFEQQRGIGRKTVAFGLQAIIGDNGDGSADLRLAEDVREDGDEQVGAGEGKELVAGAVMLALQKGGSVPLQVKEDLRGIVLRPLLIEEGLDVDGGGDHPDGHTEDSFEPALKRDGERPFSISERQQVDGIHTSRFSPNFSIL